VAVHGLAERAVGSEPTGARSLGERYRIDKANFYPANIILLAGELSARMKENSQMRSLNTIYIHCVDSSEIKYWRLLLLS